MTLNSAEKASESDKLAAFVRRVQAAELRVLRALRLNALILRDSMGDMNRISGTVETSADAWTVIEKAWGRVSKLLRETLRTISAIHDDKGPGFDASPNLVDHCEAAIKECEKECAASRYIEIPKELARKIEEAERKLGLGKGATS